MLHFDLDESIDLSLENISDSSSDDEQIHNILDEMPDVGKGKDGALNEIPLFNIPVGHYFGEKNLILADQELYKIDKWAVSCYSRRKKTYLITIAREKFKRACENARNRVKQEMLDFLKQVDLFMLF